MGFQFQSIGAVPGQGTGSAWDALEAHREKMKQFNPPLDTDGAAASSLIGSMTAVENSAEQPLPSPTASNSTTSSSISSITTTSSPASSPAQPQQPTSFTLPNGAQINVASQTMIMPDGTIINLKTDQPTINIVT